MKGLFIGKNINVAFYMLCSVSCENAVAFFTRISTDGYRNTVVCTLNLMDANPMKI